MPRKVSCQCSTDRLVQGFPLSVSPEFRIPLIEFIWNLPCAEKNQNVWHPPEDSFCLVVPDNCNNCLAACFGYSRDIMSYWRSYLKIYCIIGFFGIPRGFLVALTSIWSPTTYPIANPNAPATVIGNQNFILYKSGNSVRVLTSPERMIRGMKIKEALTLL